MPETIAIRVEVRVARDVAAALLGAGIVATRRSVSGEPRGLVCGMGICFECRVTVDGQPYRLACRTPCADGMEVSTDGP